MMKHFLDLFLGNDESPRAPWRHTLHEVVFEADTRAGKIFDVCLLLFILASFLIVMLESVASIYERYYLVLRIAEWILTILFSMEYIARLVSVKRPIKYVFSFFGIIDFISILPAYLSLFFVGAQHLLAIRILRLLRIFRVFKMVQFLQEAEVLSMALKASAYKILVFLLFIVTFTSVNGSIMYIVEGPSNGFDNIPTSMYWAIVTLTTVGYGDISPKTPLGQFIASLIMISGYAVLAVPTGIVSVELGVYKNKKITTQACPSCMKEGHDPDALFCKYCGEEINPPVRSN
jgi:voltage-gated potassium channel